MAFGDDDDLPNEGVRIKRADDHPKQSIGSPDVVIAKTSLASIESLTMPLMQEVVLSADIRCAECQKRVADVMSRMSETESVVVNMLEKKVILSCKYPNNPNGVKGLRRPQVPIVYRNPLKLNKVATIKRLFRLSSS
ncbi:uncharacterized protein LOC104453805 [Eucalyptus grandis]|uniref:Uncharacterized protein n=2 Tax=Eucalyptus grandis TaxID=71139 RepID=A0ACC3K877_EUCGR|nr:uncharacterized protein LOC104453805 [Eucalyptus grandis]KAK3421703.1 hypothetical protein EUGRSUZ_G02333 [Eucalyptus grandis]